jgi:hypothetical protein
MAEPGADERSVRIRELRRQLAEAQGTNDYLEAMVDGLHYELHMRDVELKEKDRWIAQLQRQVEELKKQATEADDRSEAQPRELPPLVKPNLPKRRRRKRPGRKAGHEPALRPPPRKIDRHQEVPPKKDDRGIIRSARDAPAACNSCGGTSGSWRT